MGRPVSGKWLGGAQKTGSKSQCKRRLLRRGECTVPKGGWGWGGDRCIDVWPA